MKLCHWLSLLICIPCLCNAQYKIDSLKEIVEKVKNTDKNYASGLFATIASQYYGAKQYDSTVVNYHRALQFPDIDPNLKVTIFGGVATAAFYRGDLDSSVHYYKKAIALYAVLKDTAGSISMETNLSFIYKNLGLYERALETSFSALSKLEKRKPDYRAIASCYSTIGGLYKVMDDFSNALVYHNKALRARRQIGYEVGVAQSYNNIGETYLQLHNYDSALNNLFRAVDIKRRLKDDNALGTSLNLIGKVYLDLNNTAQAEPFLKEALRIKQASGERIDETAVLNNLGRLKLLQRDLPQAEYYLNRAELLAGQTGSSENKLKNMELKILQLKAGQQYPKALKYTENLMLLKDSLLNKQKTESLLDLQTRYETEKKEQQIRLLEQDRILHEAEISNKKNWIAMLIISVVFFTILALMLYTNFRSSKRNERRVENLLKELHHRVKNNLQILSSVLSLQSQNLTDEQAIQAIKSSESRVNTMALIHKKLYKVDRERAIDMKEYISELCHYLLHTYGQSARSVQINMEIEPMELDVDKAIPIGLILNELISNALKYAYHHQQTPQLNIEMRQEPNGKLSISVSDNGSGISDDHQHGTPQSFGLKMVNTLMRELKGKLELNRNNGTSYHLYLPLH